MEVGNIIMCPKTPNRHAVDMKYHYLLNKFMDLTETLVFVLRKNYRQISVLHIYHHVFVIINTFLTFIALPGSIFSVYLNMPSPKV